MKYDYTPETGEAADKVLNLARDRRKSCLDAESTTRQHADDDLRFAAGEQWPEQVKRIRESDEAGNRPCLTINKTGQYVRQVVNDSRQNSPAIKVFPIGDDSDTDRAQILNGMIRDVEQRTDADTAYDTAIESCARVGEGYWRLITRYVDPEYGFDQEVAFQRIRNFATVHIDPSAIDPAGSDAEFAFVDVWMSEKQFEDKYGTESKQAIETAGLGESEPHWMMGGNMLVTDYYSIEEDQKRTLCLLKDGNQIIREEYSEQLSDDEILQQREIKTRRCVLRRITGGEVLEKTVWPCPYIPVFRVIGEEFEVDGEVIYQGLIRPQKDAQRMYNYWVSSATEKGALETKAPYIGAEGQFEGHEQQWRVANKVPFAYLEYKPVDIDGNLAPPPQRNATSFAGQADIQMAQLSSEDMKAVVGIYDAGLGASSNEKSGRAIIARQREADTGTYHFVDNLGKAIRHCGRVLTIVLPKYINTDRMVRILGEDDSEEVVRVNYKEPDESGELKSVNDITVGRYDVAVSVGPSYTTRRMEAAESMMQFVQAVPSAAQAVMDLFAKSMDWPGADEIAKRLRKMVPPQLLDDEEDGALTPEMVEGMIQEVTMNMQQQFEASLENREVKVKEFEAETDRLDSMMKNMPDEDKIRDIVASSLAEFVQGMTQVNQ